MAKYEKSLTGDFKDFLNFLENGILNGSVSASYEDGSDWESGSMQGAVRVYERYSWTGSNRVSLTLTLVGNGENLFLSLITSGGSQAVFFKINTIGEDSFLDTVVRLVDDYIRR